MSLGDFDLSAVIYGKFTTVRPSTGAPFTLAGTPAISIYKDNSTTESTSGVTLTVDFDSRTGLHHYAIDTSTDATFYSAGSFFDIVLTTGTVDSISVVGTVINRFTIRKNSSLKPATAGRTLLVDASGQVTVGAIVAGAIAAATFATNALDAVWSTAVRVLTAGTNLNDLSAAQVKAQVVAALNTDTYAEPGQGAPVATTTLVDKIGHLYKAYRNKKTQTSATFSLFADDAVTVDQKAAVSDDGTTFTSGEIGSGP